MDKELENLLDNYENAIYGKVFPINPSIHQLHLLLDYIANLEQQVKKQKEVNDKAIEYINENKNKYYQDWGQDDGSVDIYLGEYEIKELLDILKEVSE